MATSVASPRFSVPFFVFGFFFHFFHAMGPRRAALQDVGKEPACRKKLQRERERDANFRIYRMLVDFGIVADCFGWGRRPHKKPPSPPTPVPLRIAGCCEFSMPRAPYGAKLPFFFSTSPVIHDRRRVVLGKKKK